MIKYIMALVSKLHDSEIYREYEEVRSQYEMGYARLRKDLQCQKRKIVTDIQNAISHDVAIQIAIRYVNIVISDVNTVRMINIRGMKFDNDFWSEGEYGCVENDIQELELKLRYGFHGQMLATQIVDILDECDKLVYRSMQIGLESLKKVFLSEIRVETIEDIINAMEKYVWEIKNTGGPEVGYIGGETINDMRKGTFAVLENNMFGKEITIIIDPVLSTDQNRLIVYKKKEFNESPHELQYIMRDVEKDILKMHYDVEYIKEDETENIPEFESLQGLGQAHATKIIHQQFNI